jgi:hypothetical protein
VKTPDGGALVSEKSASFPPPLAQPGMAVIHISKIAPVASKLRFKGVLEAAYLIRYLLQQKSNAEIRGEMARLFGTHWNRANQERRYYDLLHTYVKWHHEADYFRYLMRENIQIKKSDKKALRNTLVRYLITVQGLHGGSEVVNDLV